MPVFMCGGCRGDQLDPYTKCATREESFTGAVLDLRERNGYNDSDFYAIVWDAERGSLREIMYGTTRFWTYHNAAVIDAASDVIETAMAWYRERWIASRIETERVRSLYPDKGKTVTVDKGRKHLGVTGVVQWIGVDQYRSTRWITRHRVGLKVDGQSKLVFVSMEHVRVLDPVPSVSDAEIRKQAKDLRPPAWRGVMDGFMHSALAAHDKESYRG